MVRFAGDKRSSFLGPSSATSCRSANDEEVFYGTDTCFANTEDHGGVGGGVAFGMGGHEGGDRVMPGDGEGGGAEPVELGDEAENKLSAS